MRAYVLLTNQFYITYGKLNARFDQLGTLGRLLGSMKQSIKSNLSDD